MKEQISIDKWKGKLNLQIFRQNICIQEENHNLIVNNAKVVLAQMLGIGAQMNNASIQKICFGTGNAPSSPEKTQLDGNKYFKHLSTFDFNLSTNEAIFTFQLNLHEFNNQPIWQFGLCNGWEEMFSMFSRNPTYDNPIEKDDEVYILGTWKIQVI